MENINNLVLPAKSRFIAIREFKVLNALFTFGNFYLQLVYVSILGLGHLLCALEPLTVVADFFYYMRYASLRSLRVNTTSKYICRNVTAGSHRCLFRISHILLLFLVFSFITFIIILPFSSNYVEYVAIWFLLPVHAQRKGTA